MTHYLAYIELPDDVQQIYREVMDHADVVNITPEKITVRFVIDDEYELAQRVRDLQDALNATGIFRGLEIERPIEVPQ